MDRKKLDSLGFLAPDEDTYAVDGASVVAIIESLLRIILAFMPDPNEAKGQLDRVAAQIANEMAEEAERRKFGQRRE